MNKALAPQSWPQGQDTSRLSVLPGLETLFLSSLSEHPQPLLMLCNQEPGVWRPWVPWDDPFALRGVTDGDKGLGWLGGATRAQCKCPCSEISNWKVQGWQGGILRKWVKPWLLLAMLGNI